MVQSSNRIQTESYEMHIFFESCKILCSSNGKIHKSQCLRRLMDVQFQPNDPPGKLSCDKLSVIQYRMG